VYGSMHCRAHGNGSKIFFESIHFVNFISKSGISRHISPSDDFLYLPQTEHVRLLSQNMYILSSKQGLTQVFSTQVKPAGFFNKTLGFQLKITLHFSNLVGLFDGMLNIIDQTGYCHKLKPPTFF